MLIEQEDSFLPAHNYFGENMIKIYGTTGDWMLISGKDLKKYLADGYLLKKPIEVKPEPIKEVKVEVKPEVKEVKKVDKRKGKR